MEISHGYIIRWKLVNFFTIHIFEHNINWKQLDGMLILAPKPICKSAQIKPSGKELTQPTKPW
jgi:hypothetical protein